MTLADFYRTCPLPKPVTRRRLKGRQARAEAQVKRKIRAVCVQRDGHCRAGGFNGLKDQRSELFWPNCSYQSEWAHLHSRRRSKTRGQAPEIRHDTRHSLMLCRFHHAEYDQHRLQITDLSRKGCDGPLKFTRAK
jgi:hypothetical protein